MQPHDNSKIPREVWIKEKMIPVLIIPVLNRYDLLDNALSTINHPIGEILIVNNGKEDYNPLFPQLNIRVLDLPSNMGCAGSWNLGIKLYPYVPYWMFSSNDVNFYPESLAKFEELSNSDRMVRSSASYGCFSLGENIVKRVGLFDEYFYPAYFEDNDYEERMMLEGIMDEGNCLGDIVPVLPDGVSQTIHSDPHFAARNNFTFVTNQEYITQKRISGDYSSKGWDLERRRKNEWMY